MTHEDINALIKSEKVDTNKVSDGYHTFGELYEHRIALYISLCRCTREFVWRSKSHSDNSSWEGWFILGINEIKGTQISYHLPISKWEECKFALTLDKAPDFDGHTSKDVLNRIKNI